MVICLRMGKIYTVKILSGDFKVTTPENPLLSKQAVTSKVIIVPYTNLQLNPYPNNQLDLFCSDNSSFLMHDSQYVTNQLYGSQYTTSITNQRRLLASKFFCSSLDEDFFEVAWLQNRMVYKTQQLLEENEELGHTRFLITLFFTFVQLCYCATFVTFYGP